MANSSARKAAARKAAAVRLYYGAAAAVTLVHVAVKLLLSGGFSTWELGGLVVTSLAYFLACSSIVQAEYDNEQANLSKDLFFITVFVQLVSLYAPRVWWLYTVVPLYGTYKGATMLYGLSGMFSGGDGDVGAPQDSEFDLSTRAGRRAAAAADRKAAKRR